MKGEKIFLIAIGILTILSIILITVAIAINFNKIVNSSRNSTASTRAIGEGESLNLQDEIDVVKTVEPIIEETTEPEIDPALKYYIKVNNQMNTITIYTYDSNGEYTIPVKAMVCSTGYASPHDTITQLKSRWQWGGLLHDVYGQYCTHIIDNILFHSVPYTRRYDNNSLQYWEYDRLGTTASAGCIRLTVKDAKWIFENCPYGTWIEFYSSPVPGPLGKPQAQKISGVYECRGWDPTDPDPNNPWNWYVEPAPEPEPVPEPIVEPEITPTIEPQVTPTVSTTEEVIIPSTVPTIVITPTPAIITSPTTINLVTTPSQ